MCALSLLLLLLLPLLSLCQFAQLTSYLLLFFYHFCSRNTITAALRLYPQKAAEQFVITNYYCITSYAPIHAHAHFRRNHQWTKNKYEECEVVKYTQMQ